MSSGGGDSFFEVEVMASNEINSWLPSVISVSALAIVWWRIKKDIVRYEEKLRESEARMGMDLSKMDYRIQARVESVEKDAEEAGEVFLKESDHIKLCRIASLEVREALHEHTERILADIDEGRKEFYKNIMTIVQKDIENLRVLIKENGPKT
jgi:hypothetical protein